MTRVDEGKACKDEFWSHCNALVEERLQKQVRRLGLLGEKGSTLVQYFAGGWEAGRVGAEALLQQGGVSQTTQTHLQSRLQ